MLCEFSLRGLNSVIIILVLNVSPTIVGSFFRSGVTTAFRQLRQLSASLISCHSTPKEATYDLWQNVEYQNSSDTVQYQKKNSFTDSGNLQSMTHTNYTRLFYMKKIFCERLFWESART